MDENPYRSPASIAPSSITDGKVPGRPSDRVVLLALVISFCIVSALGGLFIYRFWGSSSLLAGGRCAAYIIIMAVVHFIGYRFWQRQSLQDKGDGNEWWLSQPISSAYWPPIKTALLQQGIIIVLAVLTLDGGQTARLAVIAVLAYWLALGVIAVRRPSSPTRGDILLIRYGFLLIFLIDFMVWPIALRALGRG